ncbi:unnamed protein product [Mytilus coruscus]|uniref:Uncharacterized protein n=1 Tax=Mytilus coruscus TaxID=42192 RepID=A0A6J8DMW4_MYTCO|nr:unnamed protein product [Mytilus coruscus]
MVSPKTMVIWSCRINITMMVLLWLINLTCSGHTCPKDLLSEVFSCLRNLTHGSNQSSLLSSIDVDLMKRNCGTGAFDDSVQCLDRLYKRCDDPEAQEWLHKLAKPGRWKAGFDRFCKHVNLYTKQKLCIQKQNEKVLACVNSNKDVFNNEQKYVATTRDGYKVDENVIKPTCSVFHWTDKCLSGPLGDECGREVGAVVADFNGGITPPLCFNYQVDSSSKRTSHSSKFIVILTCALSYILSSRLR